MVRLRKSAGSAGDIGVSSLLIDWVRLRVILSQIVQITQRNAANCIISQRLLLEVNVCVVVHLRETLGFLLCRLIEYACVYSLADHAEDAEEYSLIVCCCKVVDKNTNIIFGNINNFLYLCA